MGMAMGNSKTSGRAALADINITPLCDVLLVLLIIFMITAPMLTQGVDVNLPQGKAPEVQTTKDDFILTLRKTGEDVGIYLGSSDKTTAMSDLENALKIAFAERQEKDLFLRADRDIRYGEVARVMAIAKLAGISRIGMMTQPEQHE